MKPKPKAQLYSSEEEGSFDPFAASEDDTPKLSKKKQVQPSTLNPKFETATESGVRRERWVLRIGERRF